MDLKKIAKIAENDFENILKEACEIHPELILRYQITKDMKNTFIEAVIRQIWNGKKYDLSEILYFTSKRFFEIKKNNEKK